MASTAKKSYGYNAADDPYASIRFPNASEADGVDRSSQPTYANPWAPGYVEATSGAPAQAESQPTYAAPAQPTVQPQVEPQQAVAPATVESANGWWNNQAVDPFAATGGGAFVNGMWYPASHPMAQGQTGSGVSTTGGAANTPQSMESLSRQAIMDLLQTPQNIDPEALAQTPENRAYRLSQQRSEERQRAQLAERAAAEGWSDSGGMETQMQGLRSQRGENEAGFLGQLAIDRMQANREQLQAGITFAQQQGQFDKAQKLQRDLADIDASIRQAQLAQQDKQFGLSLGYNYTALQQQANRDAVLAAL